jgi:hypothetical protein
MRNRFDHLAKQITLGFARRVWIVTEVGVLGLGRDLRRWRRRR